MPSSEKERRYRCQESTKLEEEAWKERTELLAATATDELQLQPKCFEEGLPNTRAEEYSRHLLVSVWKKQKRVNDSKPLSGKKL